MNYSALFSNKLQKHSIVYFIVIFASIRCPNSRRRIAVKCVYKVFYIINITLPTAID